MILGETVNLIMADAITNVEMITQILFVMARYRYTPGEASSKHENNPDKLFLDKISEVVMAEPKIRLQTSVRMLWNLYALDYNNKDLVKKLSEAVVR